MKSSENRRKFLKTGAGGAGVLLLAGQFSKAFAAACGLTPAQAEGPFYPGADRITPDNDLTQIEGRRSRALGQIVHLSGTVLDPACNPIEGAVVEIWQACASGKYNSRRDPNPAPGDPNFKYWGESTTDANGKYWFKTILPGAYPADTDWTRPPHIHFKIAKLGFHELITQMYFGGQELNDADLILQAIPEQERGSVIVDLRSETVAEEKVLVGAFDITIRNVR